MSQWDGTDNTIIVHSSLMVIMPAEHESGVRLWIAFDELWSIILQLDLELLNGRKLEVVESV